MNIAALQQSLSGLAGVRVLAVGDLMIDRFVYGQVGRISAEAPIAILARERENVMLGAAGNVARNISALGGVAALVGIVGDDAAAHEATELVGADAGIEGFLVTDKDRPTTVKTRFLAGGQQLLRVDLESTRPAQDEIEARLVRTVGAASEGVGAILISDYGKGVVTPAVIAASLAAGKARGAVVVVDSKARCFARYGEADLVKPNAAELCAATNLPCDTDAEIEAALAAALAQSQCRAVLATRGAKGMSLAVRGETVRHFRRAPVEVFDASGAGDTVLASVGLALASGAALHDAVELALLAASVAIEKAGTAVVSPDEIIEAELAAHREPVEGKIATLSRAKREAEHWRARGLKVGFTNGCFDILHPGHIAYLTTARSWCDRLIVAVNSDRSVRLNKGEGRPINPLETRALVLAGLACVNLVVPFDEETPEALISATRPDVLVKGGDYTLETVVGRDIVNAYGGEVRLAPFVTGHSTTETLRRAAGRA